MTQHAKNFITARVKVAKDQGLTEKQALELALSYAAAINVRSVDVRVLFAEVWQP